MTRAGVVAGVAGLALLLAGAFGLAWFQVADTDVFWQLKVGETILGTGRLVRTNVFSAAFPDHPWFNPEWLFQVALALAHRSGGWPGVAFFKLALVGALAAALYALLLARRGSPLPAALIALAALAAMRPRLTERPQLASLVLFAVTLLLLELARRRGGRYLWGLPPLFALWGNLHAELLLAALYLLGAAAGGWVDGRLGRGAGAAAPGERAAVGPGRVALVALACLVAAGANPGGWRVLYHPIPHFWQESVISLAEFRPALPGRAPLFWVLLAAALVAACLPRARRRWAELLPLLGLALLAVRYVREVPFFAIAAAPLLHGALGEAAPAGRRGRALAGALAAALALGCCAWALRFDRGLPYRWGTGVHEGKFPVRAADFVLREGLPANLYNHYNDGAYLLYRLHPRLGVFQDGRLSAYPEEFMARMHARHSGREWAENLETFRVNTALVLVPEARMFFPAQTWAVVYRDLKYAVLVRRSPRNAALLARLGATRYR